MSIQEIGLLVSGGGAIALGLSGQFGLGVGFGGPIVWRNRRWRFINAIGWIALTTGLFLQWFAIASQ